MTGIFDIEDLIKDIEKYFQEELIGSAGDVEWEIKKRIKKHNKRCAEEVLKVINEWGKNEIPCGTCQVEHSCYCKDWEKGNHQEDCEIKNWCVDIKKLKKELGLTLGTEGEKV